MITQILRFNSMCPFSLKHLKNLRAAEGLRVSILMTKRHPSTEFKKLILIFILVNVKMLIGFKRS